jgi:hypothetical protein
LTRTYAQLQACQILWLQLCQPAGAGECLGTKLLQPLRTQLQRTQLLLLLLLALLRRRVLQQLLMWPLLHHVELLLLLRLHPGHMLPHVAGQLCAILCWITTSHIAVLLLLWLLASRQVVLKPGTTLLLLLLLLTVTRHLTAGER